MRRKSVADIGAAQHFRAVIVKGQSDHGPQVRWRLTPSRYRTLYEITEGAVAIRHIARGGELTGGQAQGLAALDGHTPTSLAGTSS